ncbi:hypothetical protein C8R43DRAFT_1016600 [Mycena crocata]|nr:hypothetical protein C8R43DRAFT_1016600 [Mycena crocata]
MKKLFGRDKPKEQPLQPPPQQQTPLTTPIHQQFASRARSSQDEERWEVVEQHTPPLPPGASPPVPSPTRSPSPYTVVPANKSPPQQTLRKKTAPVLGILHSLDPQQPPSHVRNRSEERPPEHMQKEKAKGGGFWGRGAEKDHNRERERALEMEARERERGRERRDEENELTRKIGFLTATASEDWTLVLDVCDHASANESNAKEAVRALRREFKYGEPAAQLAAARLWAIMLRNSSDTFISQSTSRKFLDTLEDLLTSSRTSPVVRERVMDVLAAAAYASGSKKDAGFRGLWRRVKPRDKPEEGMPFDTDDAMFNPPLTAGRGGVGMGVGPGNMYDYDTNSVVAPVVTYHDVTGPDTPPLPAAKAPKDRERKRERKTSENWGTGERESGNRDRDRERERDRDRDRDGGKKSGDKAHREHHRHRIIPPDEDMRRLFQECKIGVGNATLLSQALVTATPEDLGNIVISEFHKKCIDSQELIFTQIPWASAGAERSRVAKDQEERERERERERKRKTSANTLNTLNGNANGSVPDLALPVSTREEDLLAELLAANEELMEALKLYDDLKRVAVEREAEDRSRREVRMDPRQRHLITEDGTLHADAAGVGGGSSSRSRSPSPARGAGATSHPLPSHPQLVSAAGDLTFQAPPPIPQAQGMQTPQQTLAPPPAAPHGPRLPGVGLSRTPSPHPETGFVGSGASAADLANGHMATGAVVGAGAYGAAVGSTGMGAGMGMAAAGRVGGPREYAASSGRGSIDIEEGRDYLDDDAHERLMQPSAKALGKRKVVADAYDRMQQQDSDDGLGLKDNFDDRPGDSDEEETPERLWQHLHHPVQHYVYDAAAERTQQRIREGHALVVNGVH